MNIAFQTLGDGRWVAGDVYLQNLFHAIRHKADNNVGLYTVAPTEQSFNKGDSPLIEPDKIIRYKMPRRWTPAWLVNGVFKKLFSTDRFSGKVLQKNGVHAIFGPYLIVKYPKIATLAWLPDFQHVHFPEMFSPGERRWRDKIFRQSAVAATRVVLLSESAKADFASFAPSQAYKSIAIPPICYMPECTYSSDSKTIISFYNLPEKFVYLPNQFWKHKNHEAVFQAVRILRDNGVRLTVVCTGHPGDYRDVEYFAGLWGKVSQWNLRDHILYLGVIPREHVMSLMRQCICVINPSLFEGWGMSVDEARSLGKRLLISDIPAHREQDPPKAVFFDPHDHDALAEKLRSIWLDGKPGPDIDLETNAREEQPKRLRSFAEKFVAVCEETYQEVSR